MSIKINPKKIVENFNKIHSNFYDYSLVKYENYKSKIEIICPIHGVFKQRTYNHLCGQGCPLCGKERVQKKRKTGLEDFIKKSSKTHNNIYDYSLVVYKNAKTKVKIICPLHGVYEKTPDNHIRLGSGCPSCRNSVGELKVQNFLIDNRIDYLREYIFKECKNISYLRFDFYLPKHNICIEYDGKQHYKPIEKWGGLDNLEKIKKNDKIKDDFCLKKGIKLIRLNYKTKDIVSIMKDSVINY
jgi:very-short-patch-repair endonuclease